MNLVILAIGKTTSSYVQEGIDEYFKRLKHYATVKEVIIPSLSQGSKLSQAELKREEGTLILEKISPADYVIALDENGKGLGSVAFSQFLQKVFNSGKKNAIFVIGGAYGLSDAVLSRADAKISLSPMTFSHQMVRLFFVEQLYRAFTIQRGEKYHH